MNSRVYPSFLAFNADHVTFQLGAERNGKPQIVAHNNGADVSVLSPACVTNWPRVNGDGNYGTMWGPSDPMKAKFTVDLTDAPINGTPNVNFACLANVMNAIDEKLLDFVHENQLKVLGRKNLSREELRMLQIATVRPKYDKLNGQLNGHSINLSASKYVWDGFGGRHARNITICDQNITTISCTGCS